MGNLNRRRAIDAARAAVRDDGGSLSRPAPRRFTADGPACGGENRRKPRICYRADAAFVLAILIDR
jgi:hypothetical protein